MKICLYSPYVPKHTGGGEKYLFDVAKILSERHDVFLGMTDATQIDQAAIRRKYESFLGYSLAKVRFITTPLGTSAPFWQKLWWTRQWDVLYVVTDGSLFFSLAKRNILHIQFPLKLDKSSWLEQLKLGNYQVKNTNSAFTKQVVEKSWPVKIDIVHYPMVEIPASPVSKNKEKIILNVGRFFPQLHSKRQDVLVEIFARLRTSYPKQTKDWRLVLLGLSENDDYLNLVQQKAKGLPIAIVTKVERAELLNWYQKASIYWHATGFGADEAEFPERQEHFGISTVEAMVAGCIPVVIGQGGQLEVVGQTLRDLTWITIDQCAEKTIEVMTASKQQQDDWRKMAIQQARSFSSKRFSEALWSMIN